MQITLHPLNTRDVDGIQVVPAIAFELVINHGVAEHKLDLTFGHAGLQFINHRLGDDVTLLDGDPVDARKLVGGTA